MQPFIGCCRLCIKCLTSNHRKAHCPNQAGVQSSIKKPIALIRQPAHHRFLKQLLNPAAGQEYQSSKINHSTSVEIKKRTTMKKAALLVAGLFFALTLNAQENKIIVEGNGKIVKEKRDINDFSKISVTGSFQVSLTSGDTGKISLEGDENILQIIDTQVNNGTLIIATHSNETIKPSRNNKVTIKVPYKLLDNIALNGCGTITSRGTLKGNKLKVTLDGPGHIDITTDQNELIAWVLGSGDIKIDGTAKQFECKIVGAGTVNAYDLSARQVTAAISGSGDAKVNSSYALRGRIAGNGTIAFAGQPQETDLKYMGNGSFSWE